MHSEAQAEVEGGMRFRRQTKSEDSQITICVTDGGQDGGSGDFQGGGKAAERAPDGRTPGKEGLPAEGRPGRDGGLQRGSTGESRTGKLPGLGNFQSGSSDGHHRSPS